jgi:hypothetical protein
MTLRDQDWWKPAIEGTVVDVKFKPNLLLSTKNITRGLGGQIRAMAAVTSMFRSIHSFRNMEERVEPATLSFED